MSSAEVSFPLTTTTAQSILTELFDATDKTRCALSACNKPLCGKVYIVCRPPEYLTAAAARGSPKEHVGHTVCEECASDPCKYIGDGGACRACLEHLGGRRSSVMHAGIGLRPPCLNHACMTYVDAAIAAREKLDIAVEASRVAEAEEKVRHRKATVDEMRERKREREELEQAKEAALREELEQAKETARREAEAAKAARRETESAKETALREGEAAKAAIHEGLLQAAKVVRREGEAAKAARREAEAAKETALREAKAAKEAARREIEAAKEAALREANATPLRREANPAVGLAVHDAEQPIVYEPLPKKKRHRSQAAIDAQRETTRRKKEAAVSAQEELRFLRAEVRRLADLNETQARRIDSIVARAEEEICSLGGDVSSFSSYVESEQDAQNHCVGAFREELD